jgi:hypothetical protein
MAKRKGTVQQIVARFDGSSGMIVEKPTQLSHGRPLWEPSPGRPRSFDDTAEQRMRESLRGDLLKHKKHFGELPSPKHTAALARACAAKEGVSASPSTLKRRVTHPVLRELRRTK